MVGKNFADVNFYFKNNNSELFCQMNHGSFCDKNEKCTSSLAVYEGATPDNPVNGIYSFAPAKIYRENTPFTRPVLKQNDFCFISPQLKQGVKFNKMTTTDIVRHWKKLKMLLLEQGLVLGVKFTVSNNCSSKTTG